MGGVARHVEVQLTVSACGSGVACEVAVVVDVAAVAAYQLELTGVAHEFPLLVEVEAAERGRDELCPLALVLQHGTSLLELYVVPHLGTLGAESGNLDEPYRVVHVACAPCSQFLAGA